MQKFSKINEMTEGDGNIGGDLFNKFKEASDDIKKSYDEVKSIMATLSKEEERNKRLLNELAYIAAGLNTQYKAILELFTWGP